MNGMYQTRQTDKVLQHFPGRITYVYDDEMSSEIIMQSRVRSGDYFMTLATELDQNVQALQGRDDDTAADLERLVSELLLVHKHFEVVRKAR